jgi:hypothetical protein
MLFCAGQLVAQQPVSNPLPLHTGLQAYRDVRPWRGLNPGALFGSYNTATGTLALASCTSCSANVADGYSALTACTVCSNNVAVGYNALYSCTSCTDNLAEGSQTLDECTTCLNNTGVGMSTLVNLSSGAGNTAVGFNAVANDFTGNNNTGVGNLALMTALGSNNTAVGSNAFQNGFNESNSTAVGYGAMILSLSLTGFNTAIGTYALNGNRNPNFTFGPGNEGGYNVAAGAYALYNDSTGNDNAVVGYQALYGNTSGSYNTVSGFVSMYSNTSGSSNVASGLGALYGNTTGNLNTAIGMSALTSNTTGSDNTTLGYAANVGSGALTNATALGANATVSSSNQVVVGSTAVTSIGGYENWTKFSDGRYKKNIQPNVPGLAFINKLNPVTYTLDVSGIEAQLHKSEPSLPTVAAGARKSPADDPVLKQAMQEKAAVVSTGFIAQDVEKAADSLGFTFSGVDKPKNADQSFYGLRYGDFVPPLVKAVQELSASSNAKDSAINALQSKFDSLQTQVNELRAILMAQKSSASGASLDQNVPNPFTGSTMIGYSLPKGASVAQMQISDMMGKVLAVIPLSGSGRNTIKADVSGYAAGTYTYSLIVNGKVAGTKQMIAVR